MRPAICHGDMLTIRPVAPSDITQGSVAVYRRFDRLLAHRVVRIDADDSGAPVFVLRGDAASGCDAPVAASQILGEVVRVERRTSAIRRHAGVLLARTLVLASPIRYIMCLISEHKLDSTNRRSLESGLFPLIELRQLACVSTLADDEGKSM